MGSTVLIRRQFRTDECVLGTTRAVVGTVPFWYCLHGEKDFVGSAKRFVNIASAIQNCCGDNFNCYNSINCYI